MACYFCSQYFLQVSTDTLNTEKFQDESLNATKT